MTKKTRDLLIHAAKENGLAEFFKMGPHEQPPLGWASDPTFLIGVLIALSLTRLLLALWRLLYAIN